MGCLLLGSLIWYFLPLWASLITSLNTPIPGLLQRSSMKSIPNVSCFVASPLFYLGFLVEWKYWSWETCRIKGDSVGNKDALEEWGSRSHIARIVCSAKWNFYQCSLCLSLIHIHRSHMFSLTGLWQGDKQLPKRKPWINVPPKIHTVGQRP